PITRFPLASCDYGKTFISTVQASLRPLSSVALHVTVVIPTGNAKPDGGVHSAFSTPYRRRVVATASSYLMTTGLPSADFTVTACGQLMTGPPLLSYSFSMASSRVGTI